MSAIRAPRKLLFCFGGKAEVCSTTACKGKGLKEKDKYHFTRGKTQSDHLTFSPGFSMWEAGTSIHEGKKDHFLHIAFFFFSPYNKHTPKGKNIITIVK